MALPADYPTQSSSEVNAWTRLRRPRRLFLGRGAASTNAANKEQARLENCAVVMQEILDVPDNIPQGLLPGPNA